MTSAPVHERPRGRLDRQTWVVSGVGIFGVIMSILETTIVDVALETLGGELGSPLGTVQWVSTGYLLARAVVIPLAGWMLERFGSKRVWMVSIALFAGGSMLCGAAPSAGWLIFFRVLQGLGGGMILPVGMTVLGQTAAPQRIGRVMSVVGVTTSLGAGSSTSTSRWRHSPWSWPPGC